MHEMHEIHERMKCVKCMNYTRRDGASNLRKERRERRVQQNSKVRSDCSFSIGGAGRASTPILNRETETASQIHLGIVSLGV